MLIYISNIKIQTSVLEKECYVSGRVAKLSMKAVSEKGFFIFNDFVARCITCNPCFHAGIQDVVVACKWTWK